MHTATLVINPDLSVEQTADRHLMQHQLAIWTITDRLLAGLLIFEWLAVMALAGWRSPLTWEGSTSYLHPHLLFSVFGGAAFISLPVALAIYRPGTSLTRNAVAVAQMLMSALLIDVGDGRIEMHFHIFGSLAFLAFYRDWRVLFTATIVTTLDHFARGLFSPHSIYGVAHASVWRTLEHAGWVVFEDIFLIWSCIRAVAEMRGIAKNRALLEHSYQEVEKIVTQRTSELKSAQSDLLKAARSAGMAEIATSVLHNVGNVLNSVNISATIVADKLRQSEVPSLAKVSEMMTQHEPDLGDYLTNDQRGKLIPGFITDLATCLNDEQRQMLSEVENLSKGIDHIKQIVAAQQSMAKKSNLHTIFSPVRVMEAAVSMQNMSVNEVEIIRHFAECPPVRLDEHKILQILMNLIGNARHAVRDQPAGKRSITLNVQQVENRLRYQVSDNGMGIPRENLNRIFSHGFTTKSEGHGFGLHSAANSARELGGSLTASSAGTGQGAQFVLEIPIEMQEEEKTCKA